MELVHFISKRLVASLFVFVLGLSFCYADKVDSHLNKTPVKTIKSPDGDIIDCIHISQQPALDHPSLKGHSIQRSPSFLRQGSTDKKAASINGGVKQLWHKNGVCPEETIPIRRTTEEDILRASSVKHFGKDRRSKVFPAPSGHEYAVAYVRDGTYYGSEATIDLWNPYVEQYGEFSLSQIWVMALVGGELFETLEAGWQVSQQIYGDNNTRLFIFYTNDGYATGCYNLMHCTGFVQKNNVIVLGGTITPISSYEGNQYTITIQIRKDIQGDGNWWLTIGDTVVGYWPSTLFTYQLYTSANFLEWGGEIVNLATDGHHTKTEMGSGHFPAEGFGKTSFLKNIQTVDESGNMLPPSNLITIVTNPYCYNISIGDVKDANWGTNFYYGGPGGNNAGCP